MDLILWRHAQAENAAGDQNDLQRALTGHGRKQARCMANWLDRQLPKTARVLCSPALRCEQTALALMRPYTLCPELAPDATPGALLALADWPNAPVATLLVGHQPTLGQVVAHLTGLHPTACALGKGALWWLRSNCQRQPLQTLRVNPTTIGRSRIARMGREQSLYQGNGWRRGR